MAVSRQAALLFEEGSSRTRTPHHRGGKGAGLAEMAALGLPVPPGFTLHTGVSRAMDQEGRLPRRVPWHVTEGIRSLEELTGRGFGNPENPLLVSVRSGAAVSMPGMMDTVLNVGLNPDTLSGLVRWAGDRFAYDSYRRFLAQFGEVVLGVDRELLDIVTEIARLEAGVEATVDLSAAQLADLCLDLLQVIESETGMPFPDDPREQLDQAIVAVLRSWRSERAVAYREANDIPGNLGTAVNVQAMVFGNRNDQSATGVVFSSNVTTGEEGLFGEFLINAQGEDVVNGSQTPRPIADMRDWQPDTYSQLQKHVDFLARHINDVVDVEFTVEAGKLYILQFRRAKRSPLAALVYAVHQVWAKRWTREEALQKVSLHGVRLATRPRFDAEALAAAALLSFGTAASPGAAVGYVATTSQAAKRMAASGKPVVLIRPDTSPDDLPGMLVSQAIVTFRGGTTCHAAVVARELGLPAVVSAGEWRELQDGQLVSIDGFKGCIYEGEVPVIAGQAPSKEVNLFLKWRLNRVTQPVFERINERFSANKMLNDFYLTSEMARAAVGSSLEARADILHEKIGRETAGLFATYLLIAVGGELRYYTPSGRRRVPSVRDERVIAILREKFGVFDSDRSRGDAQSLVIKKLQKIPLKGVVEFLRLASESFKGAGFGGSYGGPKWANIADEALAYYNGRHTPGVFVDHVFDLRHNKGRLFDKHPMFTLETYEDSLQEQLNDKKATHGPHDLMARLTEAGFAFSLEVLELWGLGCEPNGPWALPPKPIVAYRRPRFEL
jgi:phosphohistidine swiveling domain-containing protein